METKKTKNNKQSIKKRITAVSTILSLVAMSMVNAYAAPPSGVDTSSYNAMIDIIFWVVGIIIAAVGGIPSIIKIVQGRTDEDSRGFNSGIGGLVVTAAMIGATAAIRTLLF